MSDQASPRIQAPPGYRILVIGPIGDRHAPVGSPENNTYVESMERYGSVIEPACQAFGVTPTRADLIRTPGDIPDQIYRAIRDWELVIADLTDANPNVMYELALRHMTGKCAIAVGAYKRLPFDVRQIRTEQFVPGSEAGLNAGRLALTATIEAVLRTGCDELPVWRVFHTDTGQADVTRISESADGAVAAPDLSSSVDRPSGFPEEEEPPGLLEILVETEEAVPRMTEVLAAITDIIKQVGDLSERGSADLKAAQASSTKPAQASLIAIAKNAADLQGPATELERLIADYEREVLRLDRANTFLLDRFEEEPASIPDAADYLRGLVTMGRASADNKRSSDEMAHSLDGLGKASRALRGPTSRVAGSIRRIRELGLRIEAWAARAAALLDQAGLPATQAEPAAPIQVAPEPRSRRRPAQRGT